jgi:Tfp pilus assembly protein PilF
VLARVLSQLFRSKASGAPAPVDAVAEKIAAARLLYRQREWLSAEAAIAPILAEAPTHAEALVLRADILRQRGQLDAAMAAYRQALVHKPRHAGAWLDLGVCHYLKGEHFWARVFYRFANSLEPDNADVWNELGVVEIALGNLEHAEQSLENAVNRKTEHPDAWNNLGLVMTRRRNLHDARRHFSRAVFLRPNFYMALSNLGLACRELEMFTEAQAALRRALDLQPQGAHALVNLSAVLQDLGHLEDSLALLEQACIAAPTDADAWTALSALQLQRGETQAAEDAARRALAQNADNADANLALAHVQLSLRHFAEGWDHYEARTASTGTPVRKLSCRRWNGEITPGFRLLLYGEQGLGDEIMFASCIPDVVAGGASVVVECDARLRGLFRRSFPEVHVIEAEENYASPASLNGLDGCLPIGSLPLYFRRSEDRFPKRKSYLQADPVRVREWADRFAEQGRAGLRVGIAWRGGLARTGRAQRSLTIETLGPVLQTRNVQWVLLQRDASADEAAAVRGCLAADALLWHNVPTDLDEVAGIMQNLDLIITVCSTIVHLGGALGRPVRVMTPKGAAWRYPSTGSSLPWYADVIMLRQTKAGDWDSVVSSLRGELAALQSSRSVDL